MRKKNNTDKEFENSIAAQALEDEPKAIEDNSVPKQSSLTKKEKLELEYDRRDSEDSKAQSDLAAKLFIILLVFLIALIAVAVIIHCMNIPELKILENCIVFCQGALTTILGFLFGSKIYRKKI